MVTFKLISNDGAILVYLYYPEGKEEYEPGVITVDLQTNEASIAKIAESDFERTIPVSELNKLAAAINEMEHQNLSPDFVEAITEPMHSVWYGDHAVNEIIKCINNGEIPDHGSQAWY